MRCLGQDPGVKEAVHDSRELNESGLHYFNSIDRITDSDYMPTNQDISLSLIQTTGIMETPFNLKVGKLTCKMMNVGGQFSSQRKWIHSFENFENVTAVIFFVKLSEYDQIPFEEGNQNRLAESVILFDSLCNSRLFAKSSIILFLNIDHFANKLQRIPLGK
ncbi:guanine nucleotide binding protein, alpha subunit [Gymnopus androsaceus JB14]|uniref:Guanine nucleotide binding protein, alpha subunit n=1 Tax=Gymnopus androsaceus JB14 TaxID=1447944 RepID=A0A6A4GQH8_9AGAR|nr:guanine nucleotide binding protein, alpha subunit [Gymnopus androsaceus JB14]